MGEGVSSREYPGKLTGYVILACLAASMGGPLMFGYAIGVTGGVSSMAPFLKNFFPGVYRQQEELDQSTNQYCKFNNQLLSLFTSSTYIAAIIASLVPSSETKISGLMGTIAGGCFVCMVAAFKPLASNILILIVWQIFSGSGLGFLNQSVPAYLLEMAPYKYRFALNVIFQLSIALGILFANVINYFTAEIHGDWGWRVSLGLSAVPSAILFVSMHNLPTTPSFCIDNGYREIAKLCLKTIRGVDDVEAEYEDMVAASEELKRVEVAPWTNLLTNTSYRPQFCLAVLIPFLQQMTGINVVMFYAPLLFRTLGFSSNSSLLWSVIVGAVNVFATPIAVFCVDRFGRKPLFLVGGVIMFISQVVVAALIGAKFGTSGVSDPPSTLYTMLVVVCICVFVTAFSFSWGRLGLLVPLEISPLEIRCASQKLAVSVNMFFMFCIGQLSLSLFCVMKFWLFVFFAFFVLVMTGFVLFFVPETKDIPIDEISEYWKSHWFWKRYTNDEHGKGPKVSI